MRMKQSVNRLIELIRSTYIQSGLRGPWRGSHRSSLADKLSACILSHSLASIFLAASLLVPVRVNFLPFSSTPASNLQFSHHLSVSHQPKPFTPGTFHSVIYSLETSLCPLPTSLIPILDYNTDSFLFPRHHCNSTLSWSHAVRCLRASVGPGP